MRASWLMEYTQVCCGRNASYYKAVMRPALVISCILGIVGVCASAQIPAPAPPSPHRILIAASVVLDGKGHVLHDVEIVIEELKDRGDSPQDRRSRGL